MKTKVKNWLINHARLIQGLSFFGWVFFAVNVAAGNIKSLWAYVVWVVILILMSNGVHSKEESYQAE